MHFVPLQFFTNYIDAHIVLGRLREEGIECWLKDEHTVTVNPVWTNAVGGIKLMVAEAQKEEALQALERMQEERKSKLSCPQCGGHNIEFVSTPRKAVNWLSSLITFLLGSYAVPLDKTYHCFDCGAEFKKPVERMGKEQNGE